MFAFLAPLVTAIGGALGLGAAGGAATGIGALLGNAWLPALGTGIGTLLTGGSGKDALRNAAMAGGGSMLFPGVGKNLSGGIAQLMGIGGKQVSGPTNMGMAARFAPLARPTTSLSETLAATQGTQTPAASLAEIAPIGGDTQERRKTTLAGLSDMGSDIQERRSPYVPLIPDIPEIQSDTYQSPYVAWTASKMMQEEQDRQKTAVEDLLQYSNISENLPHIDPYTMKRYATEEERDAAMDQSISIFEKGGPLKAFRPGYATGGEIQGPGTGTSDSIPATIYQRGKPVEEAAVSDGEFVMTADAVKGAGKGSRERGVTRMYELMRRFENGEMA